MKIGEKRYFCNCLDVKNYKDHVVEVLEDEECVYCGYYAIHRNVTEKDIRYHTKNKDKLKKLKLEAVGMIAREKEYGEKIN